MKIIITGSLGHISKPLATQLVQQGHAVTVISSNPEKRKDIEALGTTAAIGSLEEVDFLTATFTGADAVYCMVPPGNYFDPNFDLWAYYKKLGNNYAQAIQQSGVKHVVNLSSIGAHLSEGNGILQGANNAACGTMAALCVYRFIAMRLLLFFGRTRDAVVRGSLHQARFP